jgi:hypothetical protein
LAFGGNAPPTAATEEYDGTTWTSSPASIATARIFFSRSRYSTSALAFGGYTGTANTAATEEWTGAGAALTKTITVS